MFMKLNICCTLFQASKINAFTLPLLTQKQLFGLHSLPLLGFTLILKDVFFYREIPKRTQFFLKKFGSLGKKKKLMVRKSNNLMKKKKKNLKCYVVSFRRSFETHPVLEIVFYKFFQKFQTGSSSSFSATTYLEVQGFRQC